jgi:NAD(P)-dependent dehydrogenase (short-subunit alcohol dehydrogenase family)
MVSSLLRVRCVLCASNFLNPTFRRISKLAGKNILITGASQGLGREMALRFARESGAGLSLVARQADQPNKVCDEIRKIASTIDIVVVRAQHGYTRWRIDNEHRLKAVDGLHRLA